jgi:hypothetical protein
MVMPLLSAITFSSLGQPRFLKPAMVGSGGQAALPEPDGKAKSDGDTVSGKSS